MNSSSDLRVCGREFVAVGPRRTAPQAIGRLQARLEIDIGSHSLRTILPGHALRSAVEKASR